MPAIRDFIGQELLWSPTKFLKDQYELSVSDIVLATLDVSQWSSKAIATSAEGTIEIKKDGIFRQRFHIYLAGSNTLIGVLKNGWGGRKLELPDGRVYSWKNASFFGSKRVWIDEQGNNLIYCHKYGFGRKMSVTIDPYAATVPELALLIIAGLYISVLTAREQAAAAAG